MTELEKKQRALMYIKKMSNGIDPLTDQPIPAGELLRNERISRCLDYTASLLREMINQDAAPMNPMYDFETNEIVKMRPSRTKRAPTSIGCAERETLTVSEEPLTASDFARRINEKLDKSAMKPLKASAISEWLLTEGFLMVQHINGSNHKLPTEDGAELGIRVERRQSQFSGETYTILLYDAGAQQFLIDNLDALIAVNNNSRVWTPEQDARIMELLNGGESISSIAAAIGRSEMRIRSRLKKLVSEKFLREHEQ